MRFVSQYIAYKGDNAFQYSQYYCFAQDFIDKYQDLNTFTAAKNGYDCYIKNVASIDEINSAYEHEMYPLHIASLNGHVHTVLSLISKQANPLVYNNLKQLPLHCSLFSPITHHLSKEIIFSMLAELEPNNIFEKDMRGNTIFHYMAMYGLNNLLNSSLQHNTEGVFIWNNLNLYPIHEAICNNKLDLTPLSLIVKMNALNTLNC